MPVYKSARGVYSAPGAFRCSVGDGMVIDTGGLKKGVVIEYEGALLRVMDYQHIKTARGSATIKITVRNLRSGAITEKSFQNGTRFTLAELERRTVQFLYKDEDGNYVFMDIDSYEQPVLSPETLGNVVNYIRENDTVDMQTFDGEPIEVIVPPAVVLKVVQTEPGIKGDTATGAVKPATLETGLVVNVPLFVNEGDSLKVDTRSNSYIERANG
jgi:elongation factor P